MKIKKLSLNRETVRELDGGELMQINGGDRPSDFPCVITELCTRYCPTKLTCYTCQPVTECDCYMSTPPNMPC